MSAEYDIRIVELENGVKTLIMDLPKGMDAVEDFLLSDVQWEGDGKRIIALINKVLEGASDYEQERGNACRIEVRQDRTKVVNYLYENLEDNERFNYQYEIETAKLKHLVEDWTKALVGFRSER